MPLVYSSPHELFVEYRKERGEGKPESSLLVIIVPWFSQFKTNHEAT